MSVRGMASEPDLLSAVRRAASEISSPAASVARRSRHSRSEVDLRSSISGKSRRSKHSRSSRHSSSTHGDEGVVMTFSQNQDHVGNAKMDAYIKNLQVEAQQAVKETAHWERKVQDDKDEERNEIRRKRDTAERHQHLVRTQIEENKMRRAEDRREYIEAASSHSFPLFTETFISLDEVEAYNKQVKKDFRKELTDQLECINTYKTLEKKKELDYAAHAKYKNIGEMTDGRKKERQRLAQQGRDMVQSWDRDLRLGNIKKAILSGKDVVNQTLGPGAIAPGESPSGSRRSGSRRS